MEMELFDRPGVIYIFPDNKTQPAYYLDRAQLYILTGKYKLATADYSVFISISPKQTLGYMKRGEAYLLAKEYGKALDDFDKVLGMDPEYDEAYIGKGKAYLGLGLPNEAQASFMDAKALGNPEAAKLLEQMKKEGK